MFLTNDQMKNYYEKGLWGINRLDALLTAGRITQDDYNYIVGTTNEAGDAADDAGDDGNDQSPA